MIAVYDTESGLISIELGDPQSVVDSVDPHPRAIVATDTANAPIQIEIAGIDNGIEEPIAAIVAFEYASPLNASESELLAAARAALTVPDQTVTISVGLKAA